MHLYVKNLKLFILCMTNIYFAVFLLEKGYATNAFLLGNFSHFSYDEFKF
jgi:hypothetical protein